MGVLSRNFMEGDGLNWVEIEERLPETYNIKVITYSEYYHYRAEFSKTFRIMDSHKVKDCMAVTHWAHIYPPEKTILCACDDCVDAPDTD